MKRLPIQMLITVGLGIALNSVYLIAQEKNMDQKIAAREHSILGQPPRISPLSVEDLDHQSTAVVEDMWEALGVPPRDEMPAYFLTMLKHSKLMLRQSEFSVQLFQGELTVLDRELAILRLAWLCQAPYEWGEHVQAAKSAGYSSKDIERITEGSGAQSWNTHQRAILRAVEELHEDAKITDETWKVLAQTWNEKQLLEFPILVGIYQSIAYLQNSVGFELEPGNEGLSAR